MSGTHRLVARGLTLAYEQREVVRELDFALAPGLVTAIIGPNGSGKSTLLRGMSRLLRPRSGRVELDDRDLHAYPPRELARLIGILPQEPIAPEGVLVAELVARGRHPHRSVFGRSRSGDDAAVAGALARTGMLELADRSVAELSGGQRQRVWVAMALAQDPDILLLDEPTTFLDIAHQLDVLDLLVQINRQHGTTIAMVLHDLNLAARYADQLVVMTAGRILASGSPAEVLTADLLMDAFDLRARIIREPELGYPLVVPLGTGSSSARPGAGPRQPDTGSAQPVAGPRQPDAGSAQPVAGPPHSR